MALWSSGFPSCVTGCVLQARRVLGRATARISLLGDPLKQPYAFWWFNLRQTFRWTAGCFLGRPSHIGMNLYTGAVRHKLLWGIVHPFFQSLKQSVENAVLCPAAHSHGNRMPSTKVSRQASPFATVHHHIQNGTEPLPVRNLRIPSLRGQMWRDPLILFFGYLKLRLPSSGGVFKHFQSLIHPLSLTDFLHLLRHDRSNRDPLNARLLFYLIHFLTPSWPLN